MLSNNECPFCDPAQAYRYIVENELFRAIYPRDPVIDWHVLIVPKRHLQSIDEFDDDEAMALKDLLQTIISTAKKELGADFLGYNLLSNNGGPAVHQQVQHAHVHVFMRTPANKDVSLSSEHEQASQDFDETQRTNLQRLQSWF